MANVYYSYVKSLKITLIYLLYIITSPRDKLCSCCQDYKSMQNGYGEMDETKGGRRLKAPLLQSCPSAPHTPSVSELAALTASQLSYARPWLHYTQGS